MKFYDTSNTHDSLVHKAWNLVGKDLSSYPLANLAANANIWVSNILGWIFETEGMWEHDDPNYTDFPITTFDLVDNQQDYSLAGATLTSSVSTMLKLFGVSVKSSAGLWSKLTQVNWHEIPGDRAEYKKNKGMPDEYDVVGNSVFMYSPPSSTACTLTAGGKFYFTRAQDIFTAADTTQEPPFVSLYHAAVAYGMGYEFALEKDLDIKNELLTHLVGGQIGGAKIEGYKATIQSFYAKRNADRKVRMVPSRSERRSYR